MADSRTAYPQYICVSSLQHPGTHISHHEITREPESPRAISPPSQSGKWRKAQGSGWPHGGGEWAGGGRNVGSLRHLTHLRTIAASDGAASRGDRGQKVWRGPEKGQGGRKPRGNSQVRGTTAELGVGSRQPLGLQEVTQIRAQNDRNLEALATYGRKWRQDLPAQSKREQPRTGRQRLHLCAPPHSALPSSLLPQAAALASCTAAACATSAVDPAPPPPWALWEAWLQALVTRFCGLPVTRWQESSRTLF